MYIQMAIVGILESYLSVDFEYVLQGFSIECAHSVFRTQ